MALLFLPDSTKLSNATIKIKAMFLDLLSTMKKLLIMTKLLLSLKRIWNKLRIKQDLFLNLKTKLLVDYLTLILKEWEKPRNPMISSSMPHFFKQQNPLMKWIPLWEEHMNKKSAWKKKRISLFLLFKLKQKNKLMN